MTAQPPPTPARLPAAAAARGQAPNNYLVWSILATLFCCLPLGIVAIVKSSQVNGLWAQGRYAEAQASADSAKKWVIWSVIIGVVVGIIYAIICNCVVVLTAGLERGDACRDVLSPACFMVTRQGSGRLSLGAPLMVAASADAGVCRHLGG